MSERKAREFWIGSGVYSHCPGHEFEYLSAITFNPKEGIHSPNRLGEYKTARGEPWVHVIEASELDRIQRENKDLARCLENLLDRQCEAHVRAAQECLAKLGE